MVDKAERKHVYSFEYNRKHHCEEILISLINHSGAHSGYGKCLIHVFDDENPETETGCVLVRFVDRFVYSKFDYNSVVKELAREMDNPFFRIEVIERVEVVEEET